MADIMTDTEHVTAGHFMITTAPGTQQQIVMVAPQLFGTSEQMTDFFQPLVDLGPIQHMQMPSTFATHSDNLEWVCAKGEFKNFTMLGLDSFNIDNFVQLVELHSQLISESPGAERSAYTLEWHSPTKPHSSHAANTSFGMCKTTFWVNILSWWVDPNQGEKVLQFDKKAQALMRKGVAEKDFCSHTNTTRTDPLEYRYKGEGTIAKLKALKLQWDPKGIFTKELL